MEEKNKIFIYLLVVFFAIFIGTGLFLAFQSKQSQPTPGAASTDPSILKQQPMIIPTAAPTMGSLSLTVGKESYSLSENVTVTLEASSAERNIVGFDIVFYYDPLSFDFIEAKSSLADFKIYTYNRGNYLLLTSVKSIGSETPTVLGNATASQAVAELVFKPRKVGKQNFSLRSSAEKDTTNLVTDQTEVLNPSLTDVSVEITNE